MEYLDSRHTRSVRPTRRRLGVCVHGRFSRCTKLRTHIVSPFTHSTTDVNAGVTVGTQRTDASATATAHGRRWILLPPGA
eukprot:36331-Eustigmatos_ZCMA.PRE.1